MKFFPILTLEERPKADLLVIPFWEEGREAFDCSSLKKQFAPLLKSRDFKGKRGEFVFFYPEGEKEKRILLLGLGQEEKSDAEGVRRAMAAAVSAARAKGVTKVNFCFPHIQKIDRESLIRGFFEGIFLANYDFLELKESSLKEKRVVLLEEVGLIGLAREDLSLLERLEVICSTVFWVRDWVNRNADDKNPVFFANQVERLAKKLKLNIKIFDREQLEKEKMGLLLAVNRGSNHEPRLIQINYQGNPSSKEHIVFVGKGVTFDTGGLSLKPTSGMLAMKSDMSGAAIVLGTIQAAAQLNLKVNVTALAPLTENCIDAKSYKVGDVYRAHNGTMIEVNDTDAEGRLILADTLSYAMTHLKPTYLIDIATLTGSVIFALGEELAGLFSTDETLCQALMDASFHTHEPLWRLPLVSDYRESLQSEIGDLRNTAGKDGGAIKAALFLKEFVHGVSWAHIDAAGPCFLSKPKYYHPTRATGYGIRLFIAFLEAIERDLLRKSAES